MHKTWANNNRQRFRDINTKCRLKRTPEQINRDREKEANWRENNKEKTRFYANKQYHTKSKYSPFYILKQKIYYSIRKLCNGIRKSSRTFTKFSNVDSVNELLEKLNEKTNEKNWCLLGYHLDHIWQINWFEKVEGEGELNALFSVMNRVENLRPLPCNLNETRSRYDFWELKEEDFHIYKPFLKKKYLKMIETFFSKRLVNQNKDMMKRGSKEEKELLSLLLIPEK